MRHLLLVCTVLFLIPGVAQPGEDNDSTLAMREFSMLRSTDGRSHEIEAIASGRSGSDEVIYLVERIQDLLPRGSTGPVDGDYLFYKFDTNGKVLHKEFISKVANRERPCITIVPLPAPQEGAIIIGMFEDRFGWCLLQADAAGKIAKSVKLVTEPSAFQGAVLLADAQAILLAGQYGFKGNVWKVDLDGKTAWKKTYDYKAKAGDTKDKVENNRAEADDKLSGVFYSIALTDDQGGFIVAGDYGAINKFGVGQKSIWLVRCDEAGNVLTETTFPGRLPSICALAKERFAILYDTGSAFEVDSRVRVVDLELKQQWEKKAQFTAFLNDRPAISFIPSGRGFVLAGCNNIKDNRSLRQECRFFQYDADGQIVSLVPIPIPQQAFLHTRVVCKANRAYVATQTKGRGPFDAKEASIFEIRLRKQNQ